MDVKKLEAIKKSFTDEQRELYNVLLGDPEKIHSEWTLCNTMYANAQKVIRSPETGPEVRLVLMKASTDYWSRRRLALERSMELLGMNDLLVSWRADAKKQEDSH